MDCVILEYFVLFGIIGIYLCDVGLLQGYF